MIQETFSYKDYKYELHDHDRLVVTYPNKEEKYLYKYYAANQHSIDALMNHYVYANSPILFNDIMDCSRSLMDFTKITRNKYDTFYTKPENRGFNCVGFENDKENNFEIMRTHIYMWYFSQIGIVSFTTNPLHPLMWAHYAQETGFAIKFNTERLKMKMLVHNSDIEYWDLHPVQYCKYLKPIDCFQNKFHSPTIPMTYISNVKLKDWKYEDEWRLIVRKKNMGFESGNVVPNVFDEKGIQDRCCYYSPDAIEAIYLGAYFFGSTYFEKEYNDFYVVKKEYVPFINFLYENHNEHLMLQNAGCNPQKHLVRIFAPIALERLQRDVFTFKRRSTDVYYEIR